MLASNLFMEVISLLSATILKLLFINSGSKGLKLETPASNLFIEVIHSYHLFDSKFSCPDFPVNVNAAS